MRPLGAWLEPDLRQLYRLDRRRLVLLANLTVVASLRAEPLVPTLTHDALVWCPVCSRQSNRLGACAKLLVSLLRDLSQRALWLLRRSR